MSINFKKFSPRPGLVNQQGRLPDPSELVCVEVPKVFDQCLIKRCLVYGEGPDTNTTDNELRSDPLINPRSYVGSRDFSITLLGVEKFPLKSDPNFKRLVISYMISFHADYIDQDGTNKSEYYEINRTDVIGKFYCPDSIAKTSSGVQNNNEDYELDCNNIIKLEMVAQALSGELLEDDEENDVLDITLGYYIVVKCELIVQLLIPAYSYCPIPQEPCEPDPDEDPCEIFERAPVPKFYPDQNLQPLFQETDEEDEF